MKLQVEYVPISTIKPYKRNAKLHPQEQIEQIKNSMKEFGNIDPIGVWHDEIVEGHGRYEALKQMGVKEIPIIRLDDLTDEQRKAYALAHNKLTMNSDFDLALLDTELAEIETIDMTLLGFDDKEEETPQEVVEDDFDEEPPAEPIAKYGDLYQLGRHKLLCGDSTKIEDVQCLLGGDKADLLLTDPPYNVALGMGGSKDEARKRHRRTDGLVIMNDKMPEDEFRQFLKTVFENANAVMNEGSSFYIWYADNEGYTFRGACQDAGWEVRQNLIWNKNAITLGRQDYQWRHEPCLYGWKAGAGHYWEGRRDLSTVFDETRGDWPKMSKDQLIAELKRYDQEVKTTIIYEDKPKKSDEHPTMKPVRLFERLMLNSSKAEDIVLDPFGGSGTTIITAAKTGRYARVMELDPRYSDVIRRRWTAWAKENNVEVGPGGLD